jgi:hypothetical protein
MKKSIKTLILIILLSFVSINLAFSMSEDERKQYTYIDFYNFISSYNVFDKKIVKGEFFNKTIDTTSTFFVNYIIPADKYVTTLE